jgi:P pilus assembly chaperone PapD
MYRKLIVLLMTSLLPAYASAGKLNLQQDLGGLDITVTMQPPDSPKTVRISNKTSKVVTCIAYFTDADFGGVKRVTIQPGKSTTVRVAGTYTDMPRSAELLCGERRSSAK